MIAGRLPFTGEDAFALANAIVHATPAPLTSLRSGVPMELERMVTRALAKRPEDRYQTAADFLSELRRLKRESDGQSSVAGPPSRTPRVREPADPSHSTKDGASHLTTLGEAITNGLGPLTWFRNVRRHGAALWAGAIVLLLLAGVGWYVSLARLRPKAIGASGRPTIAVMYFEDGTGSSDQKWLSNGVPSM